MLHSKWLGRFAMVAACLMILLCRESIVLPFPIVMMLFLVALKVIFRKGSGGRDESRRYNTVADRVRMTVAIQ